MSAAKLQSVLLVEDDGVDVMTIQRAFRQCGVPYELHHAGNGLEALELLRGGTLSRKGLLILLDLNMPQMGGIEFLEELRKDSTLHRIPVVVLTTSNADEDRVAAYDAYVAGYIVKPVTFEKFTEMVERLANYWAVVELP